MRRVDRLQLLEEQAVRKLSRAEQRARLVAQQLGFSGQSLDEHQVESEISGLVINLQSFWSNWCRAYYLSAALGCTTHTGTHLTSAFGLSGEHAALTVAIKGTPTPSKPAPSVWLNYQEPKWFSPVDLADTLGKAAITNESVLSGILISGSQPLNHLRIIRNYYGHRCLSLKADALALGPSYLIGLPRKPSDILRFVAPGRTASVFERWIIDMRRLAVALCA